jgi:hypothetical protein
MDTREFLGTILPSEGHYFLAIIDKTTGRVAHKAFDSIESMTDAVNTYSANPNVNVYHACASFKEPYVMVPDKKKPGELKRAYRDPSNWMGAKSFWIDIDCGDEKAAKGDGYITKREGAEAVIRFCQDVGLATPMMVDSGNGVHCYWPLTKTLNPDTWRKMATAFKAVLAHHGVLADPTCTADLSRILRPVGGLNRKSDTPKEVKCVKTGSPIEPAEFAEVLKKQAAAFSIEAEQPRMHDADMNDDLTAHLPPKIPSYATLAADQCAQLAQMRDTQGDVNYEHWRGVIGVIFHCEEGIELAHEWSARREETGHSQGDVDTKYNTWSAGPTTCEFFSKCNPDACAGCLHKGKITSPIILGRKPTESEETVEEAVVDDEKVAVVVPKFPDNYKCEDGIMVRYMQDKDGIWHSFSFCTPMFYPIQRIRKENGQYAVTIRMHLPDHRIRDFDIDNAALSSPARIMEALSPYEVILTNTKDAQNHLTAYMRDSFRKLQAEAQEVNTMTSFGWKNDFTTFLIGDRLYHPDGTVRKVLVGGRAVDHVKAFPPPKGSVAGYADALNFVYNREGMQPLQYAICAGFGSILSPFGESLYKGMVLILASDGSGKGKTTACHAAMYAFGDAHEMTLGSEKGSTVNARYSRVGVYNNISMLVDEITNIKPEDLSKLVYAISLGTEPERLTTASGSIRTAVRATWCMLMYATANRNMYPYLAAMQQNTEAEAVRFLQILLNEHDMPEMEEGEADLYLKQMEMNMGKAGEAYVQYVVQHREEAMRLFQHHFKRLGAAVPGSQYRFYRNQAATTLAAADIMYKLEIIQFDLEALYLYTIELLTGACVTVQQNNTIDPEDAFNTMLNDLSPRILVTNEYRDSRDSRGPEQVGSVQIPAGRYVRPHPTIKSDIAGRLYLVKKEVRDWCIKNRMDENSIINYMQQVSILTNQSVKITIGRGTTVATSNLRCYEIDMVRLESMATNPTKFTLHTGGAGAADISAVSSSR